MSSRIVFALLFVTTLFAATGASAQKIGFVDLQRALNEVDEGAKAKAKLKKEFEAKQKQLDSKQEKLKAMKSELDAGGMMLQADVKQQKMAELQKELVEVQQLYYQLQNELSQREAAATGEIFKKMGTLLQTIGRDQGFDMIVEKSAVLFAKNQSDLTPELIRKYNKAYSKKK